MSTPSVGGASSAYTPQITPSSAPPPQARPPEDEAKAAPPPEAAKPPPTVNLDGQTVGGNVNIKA